MKIRHKKSGTTRHNPAQNEAQPQRKLCFSTQQHQKKLSPIKMHAPSIHAHPHEPHQRHNLPKSVRTSVFSLRFHPGVAGSFVLGTRNLIDSTIGSIMLNTRG